LFVSFSPYDEIHASNKSENSYSSEEAAFAAGAKKNSFRHGLINCLQTDFESALNESGIYGTCKLAQEALDEPMSPDERAVALSELNLLQIKLKRRELGTIRFVGELFKKGLVKTMTMFACISNLMGDETSGWKGRDEQSIELLCKLLHTVGQQLMNAKTNKQQAELAALFRRLDELAVDKHLTPRCRFAVQEVIELRHNNWLERRVEEGPALVAEIRRKAAQEEQDQQIRTQSQYQKFPGGGRGQHMGRDHGQGRGRPQDIRNTQRAPDITPKSIAVNHGGKSILSARVVEAYPILPAVESFSDERLQRTVKVIIDEFLSNSNLQDAQDSMEELPTRANGLLLVQALDKCLNSSKPKEKAALYQLLKCLAPHCLVGHQDEILAALAVFDPLVALAETIVDVKDVSLFVIIYECICSNF
jgi:hypothetical protein